MASPPTDLTHLLADLAAGRVLFVVVGGLAAVAQGAPITTFDLDIVHERSSENVDRLLAVLARLHARYRGRPGSPPLAPTREILAGPGHSLLMTDLGPIDVLGAIEEGLDYPALVGRSTTINLAGGSVLVLDLAEIVRLKRASTHAKDRLALPILEETLRRRG
jgi:hypothetical protein